MLTPAQAARVTAANRGEISKLETALGWADSGWPDFGYYFPIFEAAPGAEIYGAAVPRDAARSALMEGVTAYFGPESVRFGLTSPLPQGQQAEREAMQMAAHCDALPEEMLPGMVNLQRLRDAVLARSALDALEETGGPVVVITGNGHARRDWGGPAVLAIAAPAVTVWSVGQSEDGAIAGAFDEVWAADAVARPDPCDAFR